MVRIPRWARTPPLTRRAVLRRDGGRCAYCSAAADTVDHVIPKSRGGRHDWANVVASCQQDNLAKGDQLLDELGWSLPFLPRAPEGHLWRLRHLSEVDPLWAPYLASAS
jgi:5-methylcytosine-specific restriction endonuclease McrA